MAKKILYVDDEEGLLEITKLFLERTGDFCVDTASSASDGLEMIGLFPYCAVVSDYEMPGMDGIAFLQEVRKEYPTLPFIIFTGKGREDVVIEALNNGASYYLQKGGDPVSQFAELSHKITLAVEKQEMVEQLRLDELRMGALVDFYENAGMPFPEFMDYAIEEVTRLSASRYGFIAFVDEKEGHLSMYGWSQQTLRDNRISVANTEFSLHETGLWTDAVRGRCPVIINDFSATPHGGPRVPEGHVPLTRYLGVPLIDNGEVVLLAGVANKTAPYDESDVRQVTLIMSGLWKIIRQKQTEEELRGAYEMIEESKYCQQEKMACLCHTPSCGPFPELTDLISVDELQAVQDLFADACNVVSLITDTEGTPITRLSKGCEVCTLICSTEEGAADCGCSDCICDKWKTVSAMPASSVCDEAGFVNDSAPIHVCGRHVADWYIGRMKTQDLTRECVAGYARAIGVDECALVAAFDRMDVMVPSQFDAIFQLLCIAAKSLSAVACGNASMVKDAL